MDGAVNFAYDVFSIFFFGRCRFNSDSNCPTFTFVVSFFGSFNYNMAFIAGFSEGSSFTVPGCLLLLNPG